MGLCWLTAKAKTRERGISGRGTFAVAPIRKGELIAVFGGHVVRMSEWLKLPQEVAQTGLQIHDDLVIGAVREDDLGDGDFVNHSCDPNAGIRGQIFLIAMRDITEGTEIAFDYAMVVSLKGFRMDCLCGSRICRKAVLADDWMRPELQKRYDGYFSQYLQERIDRMKKR